MTSQRGFTVMGSAVGGGADEDFLAKGELVGRFKRCAADAADDGGTVAADEGIVDRACTDRAPKLCGLVCGWGLRRSGCGRGHG